MENTSTRVNVVDALRGFAILGILMMHSVEQFNVFLFPTVENKLLLFSDTVLETAIPFIFAGKAYGIFALLFGFSFFIQDKNQLKRGSDFRARFVWRMVLLFGWGCINSIFYTGDVLVLYSFVSIIFILTYRVPGKIIFPIAIFLMLLPMQWFTIFRAAFDSTYELPTRLWLYYYEQSQIIMAEGTFADMLKGAVSNQLYSFFWWIEEGRVCQVGGLFLIGLLIGRRGYFLNTPENTRFWCKTLFIGVICFFALSGLKSLMPDFVENNIIQGQLQIVLGSFTSFAFVCFLVSSFVLLYYMSRVGTLLHKLEPYGKMSLTMYISQSILGGFVFYSWGLGLAPVLCVTASVGVGVLIFAIQYTFATFWLKSPKQGPLEYIWKKLTWIGV